LKNVLVLFPNEWDRAEFDGGRYRDRYRFIYEGFDLFKFPENARLMWFDARRFIDRVVAKYRDRKLAGIISSEEQFGAMIAAVIAERLGLPAADPRAIMLAQHKYYARVLQREIAPEATPRFTVFPYTVQRPKQIAFEFPFFVKPVKATFSILARRTESFAQLRELLTFRPLERFILEKLIQPFNDLGADYMGFEIDAHHMIAEEVLVGSQVTVEGIVCDGEVMLLGIVDAVMYPGTIAFERFEYPSSLPDGVQARMHALAERLIRGFGFDHGVFNIEMFYDAANDRIRILEVNPRVAYQFADLYEKVDGCNTYDAVLALATGERPTLVKGRGRYGHAASFVLRTFERRRLKAFPDRRRIAALQRRYDDARLMIYIKTGAQLERELKWLGSYRYAILNLGAPDQPQLFDRYRRVKNELAFEFA
jgi:ATP-grasp domain